MGVIIENILDLLHYYSEAPTNTTPKSSVKNKVYGGIGRGAVYGGAGAVGLGALGAGAYGINKVRQNAQNYIGNKVKKVITPAANAPAPVSAPTVANTAAKTVTKVANNSNIPKPSTLGHSAVNAVNSVGGTVKDAAKGTLNAVAHSPKAALALGAGAGIAALARRRALKSRM